MVSFQYNLGKPGKVNPGCIRIRYQMMGFWDGSGISWTICKQTICTSLQTDNLTNTPSLTFHLNESELMFYGLVALFVAHQIGQIDYSKKVLAARKFLTVMLCD